MKLLTLGELLYYELGLRETLQTLKNHSILITENDDVKNAISTVEILINDFELDAQEFSNSNNQTQSWLYSLNYKYNSTSVAVYEAVSVCQFAFQNWANDYIKEANERFRKDVEKLTQYFTRGFMHASEYKSQIAYKTELLEKDRQYTKTRLYRFEVELGIDE